MRPMLNTAIYAAREASTIILRALDRMSHLKVETKSRHNYVTDIDKKCERCISHILHKAYPKHRILGEESGLIDEEDIDTKSDFTWIIDPLDGTTNFIHGVPHFAISIALKVKDQIEVGVVYDPMRDELFTALRGQGAQMNNQRIRVSDTPTLDTALIGTGFPSQSPTVFPQYIKGFVALFPHVAGIRRPGAAALDLAYVACGRLDAFWEYNLQDWDIAAGMLLVREAGGQATNLKENDDCFEDGNILASNLRLHQPLLKILKA
jgi:myo-inositol-1(or 4)-monophosphatase